MLPGVAIWKCCSGLVIRAVLGVNIPAVMLLGMTIRKAWTARKKELSIEDEFGYDGWV